MLTNMAGHSVLHFLVIGHFDTSALNDPKMTLTTKRSKAPSYTCDNYQRVPHFTPHAPFGSKFCRILQAIWRQLSALNDPNMTLNTKRSKAPYVHMATTSVPNFTLLHFTPRRFQVTGHLRQMHQTTPKCPWPPTGQKYPIYMLQSLPSLKFHLVSIYG